MVASCQELQSVSDDLDGHYIQTGNIDCSDSEEWNNGLGFIPINFGFSGTYDGQNFTINNLAINSNLSGAALFGYTDGAVIKNIHLRDGCVNTSSPVNSYGATIVAHANNTVFSDCSSTVESRSPYGAGLIGIMVGGSKARCWYEGDLTPEGGLDVGGLVASARNIVSVTDVYTAGSISINTFGYSGGLFHLERAANAVTLIIEVLGTDHANHDDWDSLVRQTNQFVYIRSLGSPEVVTKDVAAQIQRYATHMGIPESIQKHFVDRLYEL